MHKRQIQKDGVYDRNYNNKYDKQIYKEDNDYAYKRRNKTAYKRRNKTSYKQSESRRKDDLLGYQDYDGY